MSVSFGHAAPPPALTPKFGAFVQFNKTKTISPTDADTFNKEILSHTVSDSLRVTVDESKKDIAIIISHPLYQLKKAKRDAGLSYNENYSTNQKMFVITLNKGDLLNKLPIIKAILKAVANNTYDSQAEPIQYEGKSYGPWGADLTKEP